MNLTKHSGKTLCNNHDVSWLCLTSSLVPQLDACNLTGIVMPFLCPKPELPFQDKRDACNLTGTVTPFHNENCDAIPMYTTGADFS